MAESITKNALYNILLNVTSLLFPLISAPYVARILQPDGVGLYNFANTYAGYFALIAVLGIPTYGVREVSKYRDDKEALVKLLSQLISIVAIVTVGVSIIYFISIIFVEKLSQNYIIFLLAGFVIYMAPFKINWFYQGLEDFGYITRVSLIVRVLSIISLFIFVRSRNDLVIYILIKVIGDVLADVWNFKKMYGLGIRPRFTFNGLRIHIKPLLVLFASSIAISIYTVIDTLMLGFITDYNEVGYYTNATHMSKIILLVVTSLSIVAIPRVSLYMKNLDYDNINILMNKSFSVVSFLAFPAAVGMATIAPTFVPLFFGNSFIGSTFPLMILSMLIIVIGLNNLTGVQILIGMGLDRLFLYSVLFGTVSNFLLNCLLIPHWGAVGASISSVLAETLILIVTSYYVYTKTPIRINKVKDIFKALAGSLMLIPLYLLLKTHIEGWWLVIIFVIMGGLIYVVFEAILRNSSIDFFKSIILTRIQGNYE